VLERRYRLLLRVYPGEYRAERGDEILGTLLESAPVGRTMPSWRDTYTLVLAGLQVRALRNHRLSALANLRLAAMLSLAILLAALAGSRIGLGLRIAFAEPSYSPTMVRALGGVGDLVSFGIVSLIAVALIWFLPRVLSVPILLAAAIGTPQSLIENGRYSTAILIALAVLSAISRQRPPRSWLWMIAVLPAAEAIATRLPGTDGRMAMAVALAVVASAALVWIGTDARPGLAVALLFVVPGLVARADGGLTLQLWTAAGLALVAIVRLRYASRPRRAVDGRGTA
jgi:hypothetical protein